MKLYDILHKETGLTLRQFSKENLVPVLQHNSEEVREYSFSEDKIHYVISQEGTPGFYYHAWPNQFGFYWLDKRIFVVKWHGFAPSPNLPRRVKGSTEIAEAIMDVQPLEGGAKGYFDPGPPPLNENACPECGSELTWDSDRVLCTNTECKYTRKYWAQVDEDRENKDAGR